MPDPARGLATAADLPEDGERLEILAGEVVEKAVPDFDHGEAQASVAAAVWPYRSGGGGPVGWWFGTEVHIQFELHEVFLPDIAGWRKDRHPLRPSGRPVRAVPDWVCEVLSDSTRRTDIGHKLPVYHRTRVEHAWLVDPVARLVQVLRWSEPGYVLVGVAGGGEQLRGEPFDAIGIDVGELFGEREEPAAEE